jgi:hypothetical protein
MTPTELAIKLRSDLNIPDGFNPTGEMITVARIAKRKGIPFTWDMIDANGRINGDPPMVWLMNYGSDDE